jgi:PQQ-dependent dehydrogenase (methanol/ethanol family)
MKFLTDYGISAGSVFERRLAARALAALAIFSAGLSPCNPSNAASPAEVGFHFTVAQSAAGHVNYLRSCATCHGERLEGGAAPPLAGSTFVNRWTNGQHTADDFYRAVSQMPKQAPGSLSENQYLEIAAYILASSGYAPGSAPASRATMTAPLLPPSEVVGRKPMSSPSAAVLPSPPGTVLPASQSWPTASELLDPSDADWLMYNHDYRGQRYSRLSQINVSNAAQLRPVCMLQLGVLGAFEASPVIYRGIAYVTTAHDVQAFDAATCNRVWSYTYIPESAEPLLVNRGVALFDGKLFRGTPDGHLLALDAATGAPLWNVHVANSAVGLLISAAPVAFDGRVIVGLAGGDWGVNGRVYAFDATTGSLIWKFDLIPTGSQPGAETWERGAATGGGSTWSTISVDPADRLIYVPIGNPAPDFDARGRRGANLYTDSVVVLHAETGKLAWYVQQVSGDIHDWDTSAAPVLYEQNGRKFMAVTNKAGYLYVYDRRTHALISKVAVSRQENADIEFGADPLRVCPGVEGGVEWNGPAYDPGAKALYVNSFDWCSTYKLDPKGYSVGEMYLEGALQPDPIGEARGWLRAFDAATGRQLWEYAAPAPMLAGVTPTAGGLILTGGSSGEFLVFNEQDGKILYRFNTGGGMAGGVSTYMVGGRQYVAVASGNHSMYPLGTGGAPTMVVFALSSRH